VSSLKSIETEFAALTAKPEELTRIAREASSCARNCPSCLKSKRAQFRLLVRAEKQRRFPDGHADRRQPDPAPAAVREI